MSMLVISSSLHPDSRSRLLARRAESCLRADGAPCEFADLAVTGLPVCDGSAAYGHPAVGPLAAQIRAARGIVFAFPVYNFAAGASAKNLVELTGGAWENKVVGLLCAAGGRNAFMAPMSLAGSLMLDFRCIIVPRFVFADTDAFGPDSITSAEVAARVDTLARETRRLAASLTA